MFQGLYNMPMCSVRFPSRVTGSIQVHRDQNEKQLLQQDMTRSFPLNAQGRCESENLSMNS